ncbi:hypothetical protein AB656_05515 [Bifidobacterium actinocoloniiforme DSM 22766]|nr:hypothetical protein AB656_05515 [Bifidobacterium actinocoloniiforme DSM 22766]
MAVLTTAAAFLVAAPGAHAADPDTISADDEFSTSVDPAAGEHDKVTLTKYLANAAGNAATGSSLDAKPGTAVGVGVVFKLREIVATGSHNPSDMNPNGGANKNYNYVDGKTWAGVTDANGKIANLASGNPAVGIWMKAPATDPVDAASWKAWAQGQGSAPATSADVLPLEATGTHYYELSEVAHPVSLNHYTPAETTVFSLPYMTTGKYTVNGTQQTMTGYIHHLHIFPKNVNTQQVSKSITKVNGSDYVPGSEAAVAGNTVTWQINNNISTASPVNNDNNIYWNYIQSAGNTGEYLRVVDRVSSALSVDTDTASNVSVVFTYNDGTSDHTRGLMSDSDYTMEKLSTPPTRINSTDEMFTDDGSSQYLVFHFKKASNSSLSGVTGTVNDPRFVITIRSTVTPNGAGDGSLAGRLSNSVATDTYNDSRQNPGSQADASMPSAGFQFAKVKTDGTGLAGAKFALQKNDDTGTFLLQDGTFGADGQSANPMITATSNNQGVVTFTGIKLPVGVSSDQGQFKLVEIAAPANYQQASTKFNIVDFGDVVSKASVSDAIAAFPSGLHPNMSKLNFGSYDPAAHNVSISPNIKDANGDQITKGMMNWKSGESGAPISLPLTGGKGIILLLIIGLAIMGGVLVARNRKNASVGRHI